MADVFISYSSQDRDLARQLAARLEGAGYSVWWDSSLLSGERFRDTIMQELGRSRAAIVIWSKHSTGSDWVQSEAGRAHANGKLIPVKTPDVGYDAIPLPFDNLHTQDISDHEKIVAAIVSQLAAPEQPVARWSVLKGLARYEVLTWAGVLGGALTVLSNISSVIELSEWAHWFTQNWLAYVRAFWTTVGALIAIEIDPVLQLDITFMLFIFMMAVGTRLSARLKPDREAEARPVLGQVFSLNVLAAVGVYLALPIVLAVVLSMIAGEEGWSEAHPVAYFILFFTSSFGFIFCFVFLLMRGWDRRYRLVSAICLSLVATIYYFAGLVGEEDASQNNATVIVASYLVILSGTILSIAVAVPGEFARRIKYVLVFVLLIVAANQLSLIGH